MNGTYILFKKLVVETKKKCNKHAVKKKLENAIFSAGCCIALLLFVLELVGGYRAVLLKRSLAYLKERALRSQLDVREITKELQQ